MFEFYLIIMPTYGLAITRDSMQSEGIIPAGEPIMLVIKSMSTFNYSTSEHGQLY